MRMTVLALFAAGTLVAPLVSAQQNNTTRLCIAMPVNHSFLNTSMVVSQNRLVHYVNETTQKKKAKVRVEAIPVEGSSLGDAQADSRQKECSYLLLAEFTNLDSITPGPGGPTEMPPPVIRNRGSGPRAGLHFRTMRVGGTTIDSGTLGPAVGSDGDNAALDLLSRLSDRVVHELLKERPPNLD